MAQLYSQGGISELFEVSIAVVRAWIHQGMPVKAASRGAGGYQISPKDVLNWHRGRDRPGRKPRAELDGTADAKRLIAEETAKALQFKNAQARGEWLLKTAVDQELSLLFRDYASELLTLPSAIQAALPHLPRADVSRIGELLREKMTSAALADRAGGIEESPVVRAERDAPGRAAAKAATKPVARKRAAAAVKRVGRAGAGKAMAVAAGNRRRDKR